MKNRKSGDAGIKYDPAQVRIHEAYAVAIRDLGVHGEGIGSVDGFTVFVHGALPGEMVTAGITLLKRSYAVGIGGSGEACASGGASFRVQK